MYKRQSMWMMMICLFVVTQGCGKTDSDSAPQANSPRANTPPNDPIALIAYEFLDAVRASNNDAARARLTPLAVQRMAELGMDFELPMSESAEFSVSKADLFQTNMAAVDTVWTEIDAQGKTQREDLTVVLKYGNGQWAIMAVLAGIGNGQDPDGIDFEKPDQPLSFSDLTGTLPSNKRTPQQAARPASAQDPFLQ